MIVKRRPLSLRRIRLVIVGLLSVAVCPGGLLAQNPIAPESVAPITDPTVPHNLYREVEFLWDPANQIQMGVPDDSIFKSHRIAVARGAVVDREDGLELSGVKVRVLGNDDAYGYTLSRDLDGGWDLAMNGGGERVLEFTKAGYLPVHRKISPRWRTFQSLPDVAMTPVSDLTTTVPQNNAVGVMVTGGEESDTDGVRTARTWIPAGTTATVVLADGSNFVPPNDYTVRLTEYSVGDRGQSAMPAELPTFTAYLYSFEGSVDEAVAAGAVSVEFDQTVYHYVEDFMDFPVGEGLPAGYYDRERAVWVGAGRGFVIQIIGVDGMGRARITVAEDLTEADPNTLSDLGFTDEERKELWTTYGNGQSLWRIPVDHFTPWVCGGGRDFPDGATGTGDPNPGGPESDCTKRPEFLRDGSIIECDSQVLHEEVPLAGTPYRLHHSSRRVPGRTHDRILDIQVAGDEIHDDLIEVYVELEVAGRKKTHVIPRDALTANMKYTMDWDGKNAYGRPVYGSFEAKVTVQAVYPSVYTGEWGGDEPWGNPGGDEERQGRGHLILQRVDYRFLTNPPPAPLAGWSITPHHTYDTHARRLWFGDGTVRGQSPTVEASVLIAGGGTESPGDFPDPDEGGVSGLDAKFNWLYDLATDAEGSIYFPDFIDHWILKMDPAGTVTKHKWLESSRRLTFGPDGSLYVCAGRTSIDAHRKFVRISPEPELEKTILADDTINPERRYCHGVAVAPDGDVYISEINPGEIWRHRTDGKFVKLNLRQPEQADGCFLEGKPLSNFPKDIAFGPDGLLYIADGRCVKRVLPDGEVEVVAGTGDDGDWGDVTSGVPTELPLSNATDVEFGSDGSLYIVDVNEDNVYRVMPDGDEIVLFAGIGERSFQVEPNGPAGAVALRPSGVAVDPQGRVLIVNGDKFSTDNSSLRRVVPELPLYDAHDPGLFRIAAPGGREVYVFDADGRHRRTEDALTGATRRRFQYDSFGRLERIAEKADTAPGVTANDLVTEITWANGVPSPIKAPFLQETLIQDANGDGWIDGIMNPELEQSTFVVRPDGLLDEMIDPRGGEHDYDYDERGLLTFDQDPAGGETTLVRTVDDNLTTVQHTTKLGRDTLYEVEGFIYGPRTARVSVCRTQTPTGIYSRTS